VSRLGRKRQERADQVLGLKSRGSANCRAFREDESYFERMEKVPRKLRTRSVGNSGNRCRENTAGRGLFLHGKEPLRVQGSKRSGSYCYRLCGERSSIRRMRSLLPDHAGERCLSVTYRGRQRKPKTRPNDKVMAFPGTTACYGVLAPEMEGTKRWCVVHTDVQREGKVLGARSSRGRPSRRGGRCSGS